MGVCMGRRVGVCRVGECGRWGQIVNQMHEIVNYNMCCICIQDCIPLTLEIVVKCYCTCTIIDSCVAEVLTGKSFA